MRGTQGPQHVDHDRQEWKTVALSFAAGAASMSLVWYARDQRQRRRLRRKNHICPSDKNTSSSTAAAATSPYSSTASPSQELRDNHRSATAATTTSANDSDTQHSQQNQQNGLLYRSPSFMDTVKQSVEDIRSRIGELPSRVTVTKRGHWPWETIHTKKPANDPRESAVNITDDPDYPYPSPGGRTKEEEEKSELCIGSIFGLDVGGTLAKLVYFEQRSDQDYSENHNVRERQYHRAASALAVVKARRGSKNSSSSTSAGSNSQRHRHRHRASSTLENATGMKENTNTTNNSTRQKRSFSLGLLRRRLSASEADIGEMKINGTTSQSDDDETQDSLAEAPEKDEHNTKHCNKYHTAESNDDIEEMYMMRQESVPDDLNAFATSLHIEPKKKGSNPSSKGNTYQTAGLGLKDKQGLPPKPATGTSSTGMKKSRSMFDLSISQKSRDHAAALDRFYHFARRLDSYREGVKDHKLSFYSRALGGEFHFIRFETRRMENAMELIRANDLHLTIREMGATGGGAHKYAADWDRILGIQMDKQDELDSLVAGMQFVLSTVVGECYTFRPHSSKSKKNQNEKKNSTGTTSKDAATATKTTSRRNNSTEAHKEYLKGQTPPKNKSSTLPEVDGLQEEKKSPSPIPSDASASSDGESWSDSEREQAKEEKENKGGADEWWWSRKVQRDAISYSKTYPYLLVSIGTGVSILRVDGPRVYERISGSTIGGGTYWGLIRLLTDLEDFEDVMRLAEHGDPSKVDMMVGDIYGNNSDALEKLGLPASLVASSFGKLVAREDPAAGLKQEDLARALLLMVTNNIGQVAYLNAKLHNTPRIYFVGNFLRGNKLSQRRLSFAIDFWSKGEMEALFLEHEGYFGALGAFLLSQDIPMDDLEPPRKQEAQKGTGPILSRHDSDCTDQFAFRHHHHRRSQTMEENIFS